jgi:hypothetical protein
LINNNNDQIKVNMKNLRNFLAFIISTFSLALLSGCAAGAATAGYALRAQSADSLTAFGERALIERAKSEIYREISYSNHFAEQQ